MDVEPLEPRVVASGGLPEGAAPVERVEAVAARVTQAVVTGRHVFYNNSIFDGSTPSAEAADDAAIAPDKVALLPGDVPSFANITSYARGINGVMVDVAGLAADGTRIGVDDFDFRVGNSRDAESWSAAPAPSEVVVRPSSLSVGPARVTVTWPDGAVRNRWLQVTVKASADTGLASPDVFFFGNLVGETGDVAGAARVTRGDLSLTHSALFGTSAIDGHRDFDRSGDVTTADLLLTRRNLSRHLFMRSPLAGAGMGLRGIYFENPDFTGPWVERVDAAIDFDWLSGAPVSGINPYSYSVRWDGQVRPAESGEYLLHTTSNDGVRLWVDDQLLIDHWTNHKATEDTVRIALEAGRRHDLRIDYFQNTGTAVARLEWSTPGGRREVVPKNRLYPARPLPDPPPLYDPLAVGPPPLDGRWEMIFRDEFDAPILDPVWRTAQYWDSDHTIVGGGELQAYDASGVSVSDGVLHLTARPEEKYAGTPYVSGLVQTGGDDDDPAASKFRFLYGYLEVRAKLPAGQGLWPAIWMMPASYDDAQGELDVVEAIGSEPNVANFSLHRRGLSDGHEWLGADLTSDFHTFAVDWQADHVSWFVDGVERARTIDPALICPEAMYPILNLAVGGEWAGAPDASVPRPASMQVDFVRIWQQAPTTL